ncbi:MAG: hypothetical protein KC466_15990 [Myxococcales bacterium]|nr:hypothetical protein [Myxococcales bacterium]
MRPILALSLFVALLAPVSFAHADASQAGQITPAFNKPSDAMDPKHHPKITAPAKVRAGEWFDVTIEIGSGMRHPSFAEHSVRYITLLADDVEIARVYLHPVMSSPKVTLTIALNEGFKTLKAVEVPNHAAEFYAVQPIEVLPASK